MSKQNKSLFKECLVQSLNDGTFIKLSLTSPKRTIRKVTTSKKILYQLAERKGAQEFHTNFTQKSFLEGFENLAVAQAVLFTSVGDFHLKASEKIVKTPPSLTNDSTAHNRKKLHLVDNPPYFEALSIKQDKMKQIEKFLREVEAILPYFKNKSTLHIADFGCGKAYLTFALYDFLKDKFKITLTGIDLKDKVMKECQLLADKLGYHTLKFVTGKIEDFPKETLDLAVALHACDTATDAALCEAVKRKAAVILAAPCCQHELYNQIENKALAPLLKHGILKERIAALVTDAARGSLLEQQGYDVKIVEFIDATHTPKNLLIRGCYTGKKKDPREYTLFKETLSFLPTLEKELDFFRNSLRSEE